MTVIGNRIGSSLTKSKKLWLILLVSFILGLAVTVSEPDLQVLAQTVPHIDNMVLIVTVGVGVGSFLMICMLRIFLGIKLKWLLIAFYGIVFLLAAFSDPDYLSIAFDAGGNPLTDAFGIVATVAMMSLPVTAIAGFGLLDNN